MSTSNEGAKSSMGSVQDELQRIAIRTSDICGKAVRIKDMVFGQDEDKVGQACAEKQKPTPRRLIVETSQNLSYLDSVLSDIEQNL